MAWRVGYDAFPRLHLCCVVRLERGAVVLIDLSGVLSVGRDQDGPPSGPLGTVGPIVHADAIQFVAREQQDERGRPTPVSQLP